MEKEFDIEMFQEEEETTSACQLPLNFLSFGEIEADDIKVYIKQKVYKALEKYASTDTTKELGAILVGYSCRQHGKVHVVISDYIKAKYTDASASTLTFTHETWEYVHEQKDLQHPDKKIVGWQHTHPNYGIFLSNYDMFIQENFFNLPFQVAYVIDPIQNLRGFFQWKDGKVEKLKGYYVYDEVGVPIKIEQTKVEATPMPKFSANRLLTVITALLCVTTLGLAVFSYNLHKKHTDQLQAQQTLATKMEEQANVIDVQNRDIQNLQTQVDALISTFPETTPEEDQTLLVTFRSYTVVAGDTLTRICKNLDIDYIANKNIILSLNGIDNPNAIYVGQTLLLPIT